MEYLAFFPPGHGTFINSLFSPRRTCRIAPSSPPSQGALRHAFSVVQEMSSAPSQEDSALLQTMSSSHPSHPPRLGSADGAFSLSPRHERTEALFFLKVMTESPSISSPPLPLLRLLRTLFESCHFPPATRGMERIAPSSFLFIRRSIRLFFLFSILISCCCLSSFPLPSMIDGVRPVLQPYFSLPLLRVAEFEL